MKPSAVALVALAASAVPAGYWTPEQALAVLAKTQEIRLAPDVGALTSSERKALGRLLEVGQLFWKARGGRPMPTCSCASTVSTRAP